MQVPSPNPTTSLMPEFFIVAAGIVNAGFTLPLKRMRTWPWENAWLIWTFTALIIFPVIVAILTIPHLARSYIEADRASLFKIFLCGAGWGAAQALFGLSIESIGVALGFSIVLGVSAAVGALIPFVRLYPALLLQHTGALLFSGLTVVAIGVSLCALAGRRRELELDGTRNLAERPFKFGLACALASGVLASMMNLGISFGGSLLKLATDHGASPLWCANILWPPLLAAGAIPNIAYCLYLMRNRRSTTRYSGEGLLYCWSLSVLMGLLWFGGHVLYGMGISSLGALGPTLGWPVYMSFLVISAGLYGFATGEWKQVTNGPIGLQLAGMAILCVAVFIFSRARP
jgi:L-rhamnose-H+ transport protein